jgi:hypothetical protein
VVEEGDPLDVRFLLNEKVLASFDNWCIRYQKTAGTLSMVIGILINVNFKLVPA